MRRAIGVAMVVLSVLGLAYGLLEAREAHAFGEVSGETVTGAAISPSTLTLSGSAPQVTCSGTTSVCTIASATNAATMTSTVPGYEVTVTDTPAANDKVWAVGYGTVGSPTRVVSADKEGDVFIPSGAGYWVNAGGTVGVSSNGANRLYLNASADLIVLVNTTGIVPNTNNSMANGSPALAWTQTAAYKIAHMPTTLGTCGTEVEGVVQVVAGTADATPTKFCLCVQGTASNYEWVNLMAPSDRSGNTTTCPASGAL